MRDAAILTWRPAAMLCHREFVRFVRQRSRVMSALLTPVVFWAFLGAGMAGSLQATGAGAASGAAVVDGAGASVVSSQEFFFSGAVALLLLFTAIFSAISVIEDRREGFLQGVLVSPVGAASIVWGQALGGALTASAQVAVFLPLGLLAGLPMTWLGAALACAWSLALAIGLTALGLLFAWRMDSVQGFHAVMNLVLMPMWLLSGALFPVSGAVWWLRWVMWVNPMTYGVDGLRHCLQIGRSAAGGAVAPWALDASVVALFSLVMMWLAVGLVRRSSA